MLSVILYGRNDSHGYNYHKRLALGLNCIAEVLSEPRDEILFVDYNSPDDEPTVLEALQDTLTEKTKSLLRILRVRPTQHRLKKTFIPILEPVARNVAIRRSNPNNKWILSTNNDMIFVPQGPGETLSTIVSKLSEGFYALPRFELPESLWELNLDRMEAQRNISFLREKGDELHLNTIVRRADFRLFDNPGDFQLMLRKDIFQMNGFDEEMSEGWHVDSNLCKRMSLLYGQVSSLEGVLWGYHCNHTKKSTHFHQKHHRENDWVKFVQKVESSSLPHQLNWGLKNEEIEEIRLDEKRHEGNHLQAIGTSLTPFEKGPIDFILDIFSYNCVTYSTARIFSYLADHLCSLPSNVTIAYVGYNSSLLCLLEQYFKERKVESKVILARENLAEAYSIASLFIFDFGFDENSPKGLAILQSQEAYFKARKELRFVMDAFLKIVKLEKKSNRNSKLIGINVLHTDFRAVFYKHLSLINNSFVSGITYGYVREKKKKVGFRKVTGLKKRLFFSLLYILTRYFFDYSDRVRNFLHRRKIFKKFFKDMKI